MAKNDFQYGGWNFYTLQCGTIMTLISPGDCTLYNVACGSGNMTVNSPSGSTLQRDTWLCEDMPLNSPGCSTCNVTRSSGIITLNSSGGSTLQRGSGKCIGDDTKAAARQSPNCILKNEKIWRKRFSIWRMEFSHPTMWRDRDIDFAR